MSSRADTATTRDAMLDAARELIAEIGYESMSHADITATVGIGRTTFYEHFASKEDLLVELVRRDLPPRSRELLDLVDPGLPAIERLRQLAFEMVRYVGTDHIGLILHTEVPRLSPKAQRDIAEAHAGLAREFATIYREGVEAGSFRKFSPQLAGRMMEGIIMMGGKVVMDTADPSKHAEQIARETADMLVAALRPET